MRSFKATSWFLWVIPAYASGLSVPLSVCCIASGAKVCEVFVTGIALFAPVSTLLCLLAPTRIRCTHHNVFRNASIAGVFAIGWSVLAFVAYLFGTGPVLRLLETF